MLSVVGYSSSKDLLATLDEETNELSTISGSECRNMLSTTHNTSGGVRGIRSNRANISIEPQWIKVHSIKPAYFANFMNHPIYRAVISVHSNLIDVRLVYRNQDGTYDDRLLTGQSSKVYNLAFECNRFTKDFMLEFSNENTNESCILCLSEILRIRFSHGIYFIQAGNINEDIPLGSIVLKSLLKGVLD